MSDREMLLLTELVDRLAKVGRSEELAEAIESVSDVFGDNDTSELKAALYRLGEKLLQMDEHNKDALRSRRLSGLTNDERAEFEAVERIIDGNLLKYYFQPIVSALDGEIFGYEALMRSADDPKITPYHILKYADLNDRLNEIEKATFLNVLSLIEQEKQRFGGRSVFINSIPNAAPEQSDSERIFELLKRNSDTAVVELTEMAEADEAQLSLLKDRYRSINVRMAVDDFGTGYSNIQNLLRYNPDFVKIDRSLLSEIHNDRKKRHLVRDVIEFCHGNGILSLAEGVETAQELKTVILMGVDLIQGFYTARPDGEIIDSIPYEIRHEIRQYQQQRTDGKETLIYKVEDTDRVQLEKLGKQGYKCIRIMPAEENGDITVVGDPALDTDIYIEIDSGFTGRVTLENVHLSNTKGRPCIQLSEGCEVELSIFGECILNGGGIYVPEGSELEFTGMGAFHIKLDNASYYGIGAPHDKRHGRVSFNANVEYIIEAYGNLGVCIGSGLGGKINISRGVFTLKINGSGGVCIGTLTGNTELDVCNCGVNVEMTSSKGVVIGSLDGDVKLHLFGMSLKGVIGGQQLVCLGSLNGKTDVNFENANFIVDARAKKLAVIGSLYNSAAVIVRSASLNVTAYGDDSYVMGSLSGASKVSLFSADLQIKLTSQHDYFSSATGSDLEMSGGRYRVVVNDRTIDI